MPNRMLRDWTESYRMNQLSVHAERFFVRLIMKADDYGRFFADTMLLKANLFPMLLNKIKESEIEKWVSELENTKNEDGEKDGLITVYKAKGKRYLQIKDFRQRLDRAKARFPEDQNVNDSREVVNDIPLELEVEIEEKKNKKRNNEEEISAPALNEFLDYVSQHTGPDFDSIKKSAELKYKAWIANNWKTGKGNKIKNWKSTILNTIPYLEKEKNSAKKEKGYETEREQRTSNLRAIRDASAAIIAQASPNNQGGGASSGKE